MGNIDDSLTFFLFARPSFLEGMGRALDMGGTLQLFNDSQTTSEADRIALANDWRMIGRDLKAAIDKHESKTR
jgi:hypothetical protein